MAREHADVMLGGLTVGFAWVADASQASARLASPALLSLPTSDAPDEAAAPPCPCRSEDLALARVQSRHGLAWSLGVRICATHRRLRPA